MSIQFIEMVRNYKYKWLKADITAGFTVATVGLPQSMAYALIAGVNPVYGLYTTIVATVVATFVGVSNYMIVGPTNIMALAIASSLNFLDPAHYLQGVFLLTLLVGIIQVLLGVLKVGYLVSYISHPVIVGLTTGVALIIGVGQLNNFLGLSVNNGPNVFTALYKIGTHLDNINYYSLLLGILTLLVILTFQKINSHLPSYLISVIIVMMVVYLFNFDDQVRVVRGFSSSLPAFNLINFDLALVKKLLSSALSVSILGFIHVVSVVKALEKKTEQESRLNREFVGQGIINIICSFFEGFAVTGSFTRSFANYEAGAKTRISELVSGLAILLFVILFSSFVRYIPIASLAAIVILVAAMMFDKKEIMRDFQTTKFDAVVFSATFLMTILSPRLDYAIYFGVLVSLILVLKNTSEVNYSYMSYNRDGDKNFCREDLKDVKDDNFIIINLAGTMHFHSAENLKRQLNESYREGKIFLIRMREINDIDITTIEELNRFIVKVQENGGEVILCGVSDRIYNFLENYGIIDKVGEENIFLHSDDVFSSTRDAIEEAENKCKC